MKTINKFCPFRRNLQIEGFDIKKRHYIDKFGKCLGEMCMAFQNGKCLRMEGGVSSGNSQSSGTLSRKS